MNACGTRNSLADYAPPILSGNTPQAAHFRCMQRGSVGHKLECNWHRDVEQRFDTHMYTICIYPCICPYICRGNLRRFFCVTDGRVCIMYSISISIQNWCARQCDTVLCILQCQRPSSIMDRAAAAKPHIHQTFKNFAPFHVSPTHTHTLTRSQEARKTPHACVKFMPH